MPHIKKEEAYRPFAKASTQERRYILVLLAHTYDLEPVQGTGFESSGLGRTCAAILQFD